MALHFHKMATRFEAYVNGKIFIREQSGFFGAGALDREELLSLKKEDQVLEVIPVLVSRLRAHEFLVFGLPQVALGLPLDKVPVLFGGVKLLHGRWPEQPSECLLGADIAEEAGLSTKQFSYHGENFQVVGVMARTDGPEDREMVLSLSTLSRILGRSGLVSYGIVLPKSMQGFQSLSRRLALKHPHWEVLSPQILSASVRKAERLWDALTAGTGFLAALVGGIGILTIMSMAVQERISEIALSKVLGASQFQVFVLFMFESFLISLLGSVLGLLLGLFFIREASQTLARQGMVLFESSAWLVLFNFAVSVFLALIGGLYPAYYGSKVRPGRVLRQ